MPLWELNVVEGFEDDRFAIVYRTHHAMADGISAVDIGMLLFDVEPRARAGSPPGALAAPPAPGSRRAARGRGARASSPPSGRLAAWVRRCGERPERAWRSAVDGLIGVWEVTLNLLRPAPSVPMNRKVGGRRRFDWVTVELAS